MPFAQEASRDVPSVLRWGERLPPIGTSGWWLTEVDLTFGGRDPADRRQRQALPMSFSINGAHGIVGFTYDPQAVLAWLRDGKLPDA